MEDSISSKSRGFGSSGKQLTLLLVLGCVAVGGIAAFSSPQWTTSPEPSLERAQVAAEPQAEPQGEGPGLGGKVREVLQVSSYTYLRIAGADEEFWAAVPKTDLKEGHDVSLRGAHLMVDFQSKELGRTFSRIYFAQLSQPSEQGSTPVGSVHGEKLPAGHPEVQLLEEDLAEQNPGHRGNGAALAEDVPVAQSAKASGPDGFRIEELYSKKSSLNGKTISVRGTVVRLTERVMGTNFIHLRDGSGDPSQETHDLVLKVAKDPPPVGKEVLLRGRVQSDVDLGAGYSYDVLIEDAEVIGR